MISGHWRLRSEFTGRGLVGVCYRLTKLLFRGHLQRSRKHLNTWSVFLARRQEVCPSPRSHTGNPDSLSLQFPVARVLWGQPSLWIPAPLLDGILASLTRLPSNQPTTKAQAPLTSPPGWRGKQGWACGELRAPLSPALRDNTTRGRAHLELLHVGGAGASRHRLLMNNADSGGVPDPEVELPSHRSG